jgi:Lhr-like helicase
LGWSSLRPVQELATAAIGDGHHAIVLAPTAGGKTEAALFPVLSGLLTDPQPGVGALYIAPIRALLNNQEERLTHYAEMVGLRCFKWHGETVASARKGFLREPGELLMTTPESLEVLLISGHTPEHLFRHLRYVVIDEIHALAACDRGQHLLCLLERLRLRADHDLQRIGLSATVGNPEALVDWLRGSSPRTGVLVQPPAVTVPRQLGIRHGDDLSLASLVAARAKGRKSLCFTDSRARAEKIARTLQAQDLPVFVHHSSVAAPERAAAEAAMHHGQEQCIVCTSTLELGIDVGELDAVFQVDAPATVASFLQRLGRTGRRPGTVANTTFLTTSPEALLQATALLELPYHHIFFTGSPAVGKIVVKAAAQHLTSVTLELGGKSPCIVDETANIKTVAEQVAWGKSINAGQTCIAPDYVLVDRRIKAQLMAAIKRCIQDFYGEDPAQSPDYGRIISPRHFDRLSAFLDSGEAVVGGQTDPDHRTAAATAGTALIASAHVRATLL